MVKLKTQGKKKAKKPRKKGLGQKVSDEVKKLGKGKKKKGLGKRGSDDAKKRKPKFKVPTSERAQKRREEDGSSDLLKLRDGLNRLIVLPAPVDSGLDFPWIEVRQHFIGGNDVMAALGMERPEDFPIAHGCVDFHEKRPCGWCDLQLKLRRGRSSRDRKLAGALFAGLQCFANVVDLAQPKVVRKFRFGKTIRNDLLTAIEDGDIFCDPDDLLEIRIRKTSTGSKPWDVDYSTRVMSKKSHGAIRNKWIAGLHDLTQFMPLLPTPDEIEEAKDILFSAADAADDDTGLEEEDLDGDDDDIPDFD